MKTHAMAGARASSHRITRRALIVGGAAATLIAPRPAFADYPRAVSRAQRDWDAKSVWNLRKLQFGPTGDRVKTLPEDRDMLPAGARYRDRTLFVTRPNVVLRGWDFRASRCAVRVESTDCRIIESIFGGRGVDVPLWVGRYTHGSSCRVINCEIDGTGCGTLFAGIFQLGYGSTAPDTSSSLTLSYCHIHNAPRQTACQTGSFLADHCWFGAPGVNGIPGDHVSASHVYGGSARFTNCLFDGKDGWGLTPANSWTAWLFYEPYSTSNITGGLIENCIFVNPDPGGHYTVTSVNVGTKTVSNLIIRNNVIQAGASGFWFRPPIAGITELYDNFDFSTAQRIQVPFPIR